MTIGYTWPEPRMIETNGINLAVFEAGPKDGPAVVFCHGFPELAFSWRYQMQPLADAGFHVIAPDQRGYGKSDKPDNVTDYDIHHLTADLAGMLDALGHDKAVFVGHDWGGLIVWPMAQLHPDRVAGVVGVNVPFMPRTPMDPIELMKAMMGESMYIVNFQTSNEADKLMESNPRKVFERFMTRPTMKLEDFQSVPQEDRVPSMINMLSSEPLMPLRPFLSEEEIQYFVDAFTNSGFTRPINYYRNISRNWETTPDAPQRVEVPCLIVMADTDYVLPPSLADGVEAFVPDVEKHVIKDCGHWTQQEQPEAFNEILVDWLTRRFK